MIKQKENYSLWSNYKQLHNIFYMLVLSNLHCSNFSLTCELTSTKLDIILCLPFFQKNHQEFHFGYHYKFQAGYLFFNNSFNMFETYEVTCKWNSCKKQFDQVFLWSLPKEWSNSICLYLPTIADTKNKYEVNVFLLWISDQSRLEALHIIGILQDASIWLMLHQSLQHDYI